MKNSDENGSPPSPPVTEEPPPSPPVTKDQLQKWTFWACVSVVLPLALAAIVYVWNRHDEIDTKLYKLNGQVEYIKGYLDGEATIPR